MTRQRVVMIGVEGFPELMRWVAEGATLEQRRARGEFAKHVVEDMLNGVDHAAINKALRDEARRQSHGDPR